MPDRIQPDDREPDTIAVVIPVYNGREYLAEALTSVFAQTLLPDEVVVMDDGSTDDSAEIARSFPGVTVYTQQNAGLATSRNRAMEKTCSKWLAFLDHDDIWEPEKLQRQLDALKSTPGAAFCLTGRRDLRQIPGTNRFAVEPCNDPPLKPGRIGRLLYTSLRIAPSCVMVKRSAILDAGGFDPTVGYTEDWEMWLRLEQKGTIFVACNESLLQYRIHNQNMSNDAWKMYRGEMNTFERRIAPRAHPLLRPFVRLRAKSRFLAGVALVHREQNLPYLGTMMKSILQFPFGYIKRHKVVVLGCLRKAGIRR